MPDHDQFKEGHKVVKSNNIKDSHNTNFQKNKLQKKTW